MANLEAKLSLLEQLSFLRYPQLLATVATLLPTIQPQAAKLCQELVTIFDHIKDLHFDVAELASIPANKRVTALHKRRLACLINSSRT